MSILSRQSSQDIKNFDKLLEIISAHLRNLESQDSVTAMILELEGVNDTLALYHPSDIYQKREEVLHIIDEILPRDAEFFLISRDSFCVIFDNHSIIEVREIARNLVDKISDSNISEIDCVFHIGIAQGAAGTIIAKTFYALKKAKSLGIKAHFYDISDEDFSNARSDEARKIALVKNAILQGEILTFYQPIYDNKSRQITKYECLARLMDNERLLYPNEFFNIVLRKGLMGKIIYAIIDNSFKVFRHNNYDFSLNIAEEDLRDTQMIEYLCAQCEKYRINPKRIVLEILESVELGDDDLLLKHIFMLKRQGFQIAIDDFGYANSNFGRLIKMQVDYIKIDGRFIERITEDSTSYEIVKSIVSFAKTISVECVAEYVHSRDIFEAIVGLGIEYSQGHFIGEAKRDIDENLAVEGQR